MAYPLSLTHTQSAHGETLIGFILCTWTVHGHLGLCDGGSEVIVKQTHVPSLKSTNACFLIILTEQQSPWAITKATNNYHSSNQFPHMLTTHLRIQHTLHNRKQRKVTQDLSVALITSEGHPRMKIHLFTLISFSFVKQKLHMYEEHPENKTLKDNSRHIQGHIQVLLRKTIMFF